MSIIEREPASFDLAGSRHTCGYLYTVDVIEVVRGAKSSLKFFSQHDQLTDQAGDDYFVVVNRARADEIETARERLAPALPEPDRARLLCRLSASEYSIATNPVVMIPFDSAFTEMLGGRWVRRQPSNLLWRDEFPHRDLDVDGLLHSAVKWADVKEFFRQK